METKSIYSLYLKRILDFLFSLLLLIVFSPLIVILSFLVKINLGSPVFFKQERPGKNEEVFTMLKYRSMTSMTDSSGELLPDSERLTLFGKFLRSTSLDELPELLNILKGDMSFVGPRPLLTEYLDLYDDSQRKRHLVRPGLTGLAQVNGRNAINWETKFMYDIEYINKIGFMTDLKICVLTIKKVLCRENINQESNVTAEKFKGTKKLQTKE